MNFLGFVAFRSLALLFATTVSIMMVMLWLNIITMDDVVNILDLRKNTEECKSVDPITPVCESSTATALRNINDKFQVIGQNLLNILSELMNRLFGWAGIDVNLSKIKIDIHSDPGPPVDVLR